MAQMTITRNVWEPLTINLSGIRRLRLIDSYKVEVTPDGIIGQTDIEVFEFVFPKEIPASFRITKQLHESGQPFWNQQLSFFVPHATETRMQWQEKFQQTRWVALVETTNQEVCILGGAKDRGLVLSSDATCGQGLAGKSAVEHNFLTDQLRPLISLEKGFEDAIETLAGDSWYGVGYNNWNPDPALVRTGNLELHESLPVQSRMRGCILFDDGSVNYYLDAEDWGKKEDGSASDLTGNDGMVMVEIPEHYRQIVSEPAQEVEGEFWQEGSIWQEVRISLYPSFGYTRIPKYYYAAFESALDRQENKLASVVNTTMRYCGSDGTQTRNLGQPATGLDLQTSRDNVRRRGTGWELMSLNELDPIRFLFMVEFAHRDSQLILGDGIGVPTAEVLSNGWMEPVAVCGITNGHGNKSGKVYIEPGGVYGEKEYNIEAVRYRGIENIFGHLFEYIEGVVSDASEIDIPEGKYGGVYKAKSPAGYDNFAINNTETWSQVFPYHYGIAFTGGNIKDLMIDSGLLLPRMVGPGDEGMYYPDNALLIGEVTDSFRILHGGGLLPEQLGPTPGLFCIVANTPTLWTAYISNTTGSRIVYRQP